MKRFFLGLAIAGGLIAGACGSDGPTTSIGERTILETRCGGGGDAAGCPDRYVCVGQEVAVDGPGACRRLCTLGDACDTGATCRSFYDGCTGADCVYVCVPATCGGFGGAGCASGSCGDDGTDGCEPDTTADCPGACLPE
jgi:hypothetical protein